MPTMMVLSLGVNIAVLVPVSVGLALDHPRMTRVFGPRTQSRDILRSIYLAILVVSGGLLALGDAHAASALLVVQIVYKLTTPFTVGTTKNPVVLSNLAISAVHFATLVSLTR